MAQGTGFQGTYNVTPKPREQVEAGRWYYGFTCLECNQRFAVFDDDSNGKTRVRFEGDGHFLVACPHCDADRLYLTSQVEHFQAERLA